MMKKMVCIIVAVLFMVGCSTDSRQSVDLPDYSGYLPSITWCNTRGLTPEVYGVQNSKLTAEMLDKIGREAAMERHGDEALQESIFESFPENGVCTNEAITQYSALLGLILKDHGYFGTRNMMPVDATHYVNDIWCVCYNSAEHSGDQSTSALTIYFHAIDGHIIRVQLPMND